MIDLRHGWNVSFKPPIIGFFTSLVLLLAAHRIVVHKQLTGSTLVGTLVVLAALQVIMQLILFLHLGLESKPRWNIATFLFTVLIVLIIFGGTIWIMYNLNYDLMMNLGR